VFTALLAACVIIYGCYMLFDNIYAGRNAFTSRNLIVYRPSEDSSSKEKFEKLQDINEDINAWLTIYDTKIDYPVAQGENDLEYANKDIFGQQSLTGSIYLSTVNDRDYSNKYNVIFGHHMINGAMFGDLDKYEDMDYFLHHRDGVLQTPEGNYNLKVFAFLRTDAYDNMVYYLDSTKRENIPMIMDYLSKNSDNYINYSNDEVTKIVALSTCADSETNGRAVVFLFATRRSNPIEDEEEVKARQEALQTSASEGRLGHEVEEDHWAVLNLFCVIATLLTLLPLLFTRRKYYQLRYAKRLVEEYEKTEFEKLVDDLKHFIKKMKTGVLIELIAMIAAFVVFILTEDITKPVVIFDKWTGLMIFIFSMSLLTDVVFIRYRGERPPEE
jgi:SrtB family sortase